MCDNGRLNGKTAIITGAASGIGKATAILFAKEGAKLVLADISEPELEGVKTEAALMGGEVEIKITDVGDEAQVKDLVDFILKKYQQIDIVCNNAGIIGDMSRPDLADQDGENWQKVYQINVVGAVHMLKYVSQHMRERQTGSIVNTASVAGLRSGAGPKPIANSLVLATSRLLLQQ